MTVTVLPPPTGVDDVRTTPHATPVSLDVLANDGGTGRSVSSITQPPVGQGTSVLNADGTVTYTPPAGFSGTTSFTYLALDADQVPYTQTVTITVLPLAGGEAPSTPGPTTSPTPSPTPSQTPSPTTTQIGPATQTPLTPPRASGDGGSQLPDTGAGGVVTPLVASGVVLVLGAGALLLRRRLTR